MGRLQGKVALITGAGSGIGRASARIFSEEGARVVVVDIALQGAEETVNDIAQSGGEAIALQCDVASAADVMKMMETVIDTYGRLDILFNNAGIVLPKFIEEVTEQEWDRLFDVNVKGTFLCTKYALPHIRAVKGCIVNMGSMTGLAGQMRNATYSATKGAIAAFTRSLALDVAEDGVRVNSICPAGVLTPLLEKWFSEQENPEEFRRGQDLSHMLGRTALPEEIARVAVFLASEDASFITGQSIPVEGGATIGYGVGPKAELV